MQFIVNITRAVDKDLQDVLALLTEVNLPVEGVADPELVPNRVMFLATTIFIR